MLPSFIPRSIQNALNIAKALFESKPPALALDFAARDGRCSETELRHAFEAAPFRAHGGFEHILARRGANPLGKFKHRTPSRYTRHQGVQECARRAAR